MIPQSLLKPPLLGAGAYKVTELLNAGATASARNRDSNKEDIFTGLTSRIAPERKAILRLQPFETTKLPIKPKRNFLSSENSVLRVCSCSLVVPQFISPIALPVEVILSGGGQFLPGQKSPRRVF